MEGNTLKKVALTGGPPVTIAHTGQVFGATWAPDDTIIFATSDPATGLQRVSAAGGAVSGLTQPAPARGELDHLWPEMLPGGRAVLMTITATTGGLAAAQVAVLDLVTGTHSVLVRGGSHAHYVTSGHLVYTAEGTLRAVPFDLTRLETRGTPVTVLPRLVTTPRGSGDFVVAADGTLAYVDAPGATRGGGAHAGLGGSARARGGIGRAAPPLLPPAHLARRDAGGGRDCGSGERHLGVGSRLATH